MQANNSENTPVDLRLTADYAICSVDLPIIENPVVDIDDQGNIIGVYPSKNAPVCTPKVQQNLGGLLMPGLVNAHAHTPMTLMRSAGDGAELQSWLFEKVIPRELKMTSHDAHLGMLIGSAEMLCAGVTTSCEMYLHAEALAEATAQSGARLVMTCGIVNALANAGRLDALISEIIDTKKRLETPDELLTVGFGPHSLYDLSIEQVSEIAQAAIATDSLVHIHLEETEAERELVKSKYGATATQVLHDHGVLEASVLAAHGVWLSPSDMDLLAQSDTSVVSCPVSNLKLGSGIANISEMTQRNVNVALGTDGPASNDSLRMWDDLKLLALLARGSTHNAQALSAKTAFDIATRRGAQAVGLKNTGVLQTAFYADIVRLETEAFWFSATSHDEIWAQLCFAASGENVTDVWVHGKHVYKDSQCVGVDTQNLFAKVRETARRLAS